LYDLLRPSAQGKIGSPVLNGRPKPAVGDPDPTYPGNTIQARDGGDPDYQWLSGKANQAKGSGSAAYMKNADPSWVQEQVQLENVTRARLQNLLSALAALPQR
jgi:hypothetical protein